MRLSRILYPTCLSLSTFLSFSASPADGPASVPSTPDLFLYHLPATPPVTIPELSDDAPAALPRYKVPAEEKDWPYLKAQSYTILGLSVATAGLMTLLPTSVTHWGTEERSPDSVAQKWLDNVTSGPVWDEDDHFLNYVTHPYFGGVYYTTARHAGFDIWESFLYSAALSTFYWEYGIEAIAERPSIQDLIVTPVFGAAVGEWMLQTEAEIVANGGRVMHSAFWGDVSLFLLNPVGHIHHWVSDWWDQGIHLQLTTTPWRVMPSPQLHDPAQSNPYADPFIGLRLSVEY